LFLEFQDDRSAYFLASSSEEAAEWVAVLKKASYSYLKQRYNTLKEEVEKLRESQNVSVVDWVSF